MARSAYDRLSSLDASFLALETRSTHMHVAGISIFEASPVSDGDGVDIDRLRRFIGSRLQYVPRYRQRLAHVPVERHPVWVDDEHFNLDYHVRHSSLPRPGSESQLKLMAGRIISQQLDRTKPLWEMWVVEGLEENRFAIISKIHHSMIDGVAGAGIMSAILGFAPSDAIEDPDDWVPRRVPSDADLVVGEVARRISDSLERVKSSQQALEDTRSVVFEGLRRGRAVYNSLTSGWLSQAPVTPLNKPIGPNRRLDWMQMDLEDLKSVRRSTGATINDIVLATTAGALREFLITDRAVSDLDIDFRVMAPVSVRTKAQAGDLGNQVAMWLVHLPLDEPDPLVRLHSIQEETMRLKRTEQALGASTIVNASTGAPHGLVSLGARLATGVRPFNMTVTNVPGPQFPLYLLDAQLVEQYPVVPLWHNHGVGLALFSYNGNVAWGINADWDLLPDSDRLIGAIHTGLAELREAAERANPGSTAPAEPASAGEETTTSAKKPAPAKKASAKKTPAKTTTAKTTAKKTPPKKAPAKKPSATTAAKKAAAAKKTVAAKKPPAAGTTRGSSRANGAGGRASGSRATTSKAGSATDSTKKASEKASSSKASSSKASSSKSNRAAATPSKARTSSQKKT